MALGKLVSKINKINKNGAYLNPILQSFFISSVAAHTVQLSLQVDVGIRHGSNCSYNFNVANTMAQLFSTFAFEVISY